MRFYPGLTPQVYYALTLEEFGVLYDHIREAAREAESG